MDKSILADLAQRTRQIMKLEVRTFCHACVRATEQNGRALIDSLHSARTRTGVPKCETECTSMLLQLPLQLLLLLLLLL